MPEAASMGSGQPEIVLEALTLSRGGTRQLISVNLRIAMRARTVIMGPNGAGKTTLLQLIHGLLAPDAGEIRIVCAAAVSSGETPIALSPPLGFVFQRPVMLRRSVIGNIEHALAVNGVAEPQRSRFARAALDRVGLTPLADRPARRLSGGEQQRVAIARADALSPQCLLLDEPCAGLDPASTAAIERYLLRRSEEGRGFVMSTHDLAQARRIADQVIFLHRGRVLECTPASRFFNEPESEFARRFLAGELLDA